MFKKISSLLNKTTDKLTKKLMISNAMEGVTGDLHKDIQDSFNSGDIERGLNTISLLINQCFKEPYFAKLDNFELNLLGASETVKTAQYDSKLRILNSILNKTAMNIEESQIRTIKPDNILETVNPNVLKDKTKFLTLNCAMLEYLIVQQGIDKSSKRVKNRLFLVFSTSGNLLLQSLEKGTNDDSITEFWQSKYRILYEKLIKSSVGSISSVDLRHIELLIK